MSYYISMFVSYPITVDDNKIKELLEFFEEQMSIDLYHIQYVGIFVEGNYLKVDEFVELMENILDPYDFKYCQVLVRGEQDDNFIPVRGNFKGYVRRENITQ